MTVVLITGTTRGLGLSLVKLLSTSVPSISTIIATGRSPTPTPALQSVITSSKSSTPSKVHYIPLDTTSSTSISSAVTQTSTLLSNLHLSGIDILINNAGILDVEPQFSQNLILPSLSKSLSVNVTAVNDVTSAFLPLLRLANPASAAKKIVNVTSTFGSIALSPNFTRTPAASYKISKAALNMLTVQTAIALEDDPAKFTVFAVSPGWLKTDLGTQHADLEVDVGAKALWDVIEGATREKDNGVFRDIHVEWHKNYPGTNPPW